MQGNTWSPRKHFKPNILHVYTEYAKPRKMLELDFHFQFRSQVIAAFVSQYIEPSACRQSRGNLTATF